MKKIKNQKAKRKPHRQEGVYMCNGIERVVTIHPTKGFRDRNINRGFNVPGVVRAKSYRPKILNRENLQKIFNAPQVENKAPEITRKKLGA